MMRAIFSRVAPSEAYRERGYDLIESGALEELGASFGEAWRRNPLPSLLRAMEQGGATGIITPEMRDFLGEEWYDAMRADEERYLSRRMSEEEWRGSEYYREGLHFPQGVREDVARILAERKDTERSYQDVMRRSPGGFGRGAMNIGAELIASAMDPLNLATAFVPVVGPARAAILAAKVGKWPARAMVGAAEGLAGAAMVEPVVLAAASMEQADYNMTDSLINVAFGSVLGGGLHTGAGAIGDFLARRVSPRVRDATLRAAVAQHVEDHAVNVEPVIRAEPVTPQRAAVEVEEVPFARPAIETVDLAPEVREAPVIRPDDPMVEIRARADAEIRQRAEVRAAQVPHVVWTEPTKTLQHVALPERYGPMLRDLQDEVAEAEGPMIIPHIERQGGVNFQEYRRLGSSYPEWMSDRGWTKKEVLKAIDKAIAGKRLGKKQADIVSAAIDEAHDRLARGVDQLKVNAPTEEIAAAGQEFLDALDEVRYGTPADPERLQRAEAALDRATETRVEEEAFAEARQSVVDEIAVERQITQEDLDDTVSWFDDMEAQQRAGAGPEDVAPPEDYRPESVYAEEPVTREADEFLAEDPDILEMRQLEEEVAVLEEQVFGAPLEEGATPTPETWAPSRGAGGVPQGEMFKAADVLSQTQRRDVGTIEPGDELFNFQQGITNEEIAARQRDLAEYQAMKDAETELADLYDSASKAAAACIEGNT